MGCVDPWVGLGWVHYSKSTKNLSTVLVAAISKATCNWCLVLQVAHITHFSQTLNMCCRPNPDKSPDPSPSRGRDQEQSPDPDSSPVDPDTDSDLDSDLSA